MNLPATVLIEQIEMKFQNDESKFAMFQKYLKLGGITSSSVRKEEVDR
jgi:hypothetical protein